MMPQLFIEVVVDENPCTLTLNVEITETIREIKERARQLINVVPRRTRHGSRLSRRVAGHGEIGMMETLGEGWPVRTLGYYHIEDGDTIRLSNVMGHSF